MKLSEYLKKERVTLEEFGARLGVSASTVHRYATGARVPKQGLMSLIFHVTAGQVTPNDFFNLSRAPESDDAA